MTLGGSEVLVLEATSPNDTTYSSKARSDRDKVMQGLKDMLDVLLLDVLNGITAEEVTKVFTIGVQIIGE